jgi:hypothetical protein
MCEEVTNAQSSRSHGTVLFYSDYVPVHKEDRAGGGHTLRRHHYGGAGAGGQAAPRTLSTKN